MRSKEGGFGKECGFIVQDRLGQDAMEGELNGK